MKFDANGSTNRLLPARTILCTFLIYTLGIEPLFAHPYYPQDKGKVERTIRNVAEEFVNLLTKFPQWIGGQIKKYEIWYNEERLRR